MVAEDAAFVDVVDVLDPLFFRQVAGRESTGGEALECLARALARLELRLCDTRECASVLEILGFQDNAYLVRSCHSKDQWVDAIGVSDISRAMSFFLKRTRPF